LAIAGLLFAASYVVRVMSVILWFVCYFFPAYFTLIAMRDGNKEDCLKYLIYWILYPVMVGSEDWVRMLFNRTTFRIMRVAFTILMLNPAFDLGSRLYTNYLKPML
jgi:hypothetical protein